MFNRGDKLRKIKGLIKGTEMPDVILTGLKQFFQNTLIAKYMIIYAIKFRMVDCGWNLQSGIMKLKKCFINPRIIFMVPIKRR